MKKHQKFLFVKNYFSETEQAIVAIQWSSAYCSGIFQFQAIKLR